MKKTLFLWIGVLFIAFSGGGGCNLFSDIANKTSDAAIVDDINNLIDAGKYYDAIGKWGTLSPAGQAVEANKVLLATAYAGLGGLDVINLANNLSGSADPTLFLTLMHAFKGSTIQDFLDEVSAESVMLGISVSASGRTTDENTFMVFLELAKLGTLLAATADTNADGTVDAGFTGCSIPYGSANNYEAEHVATAVGILVDSLNAISNSIASSSANALTSNCALSTYKSMCSVFQVTSVSTAQIQAAKTLVGENNLNIGLQVASTKNQCELSGGAPPCLTDAVATLCPYP